MRTIVFCLAGIVCAMPVACAQSDPPGRIVAQSTAVDPRTLNSPGGEALIYSEYLSQGTVAAVAVDNSGNTYVTGSNSGYGFYLTEFNSNGTVVHNRSFGTGTINPSAIAVDGSGIVHVTGATASDATLPTASTSFMSSATAPGNAFYAEIASDEASVLYATFLGGSDLNDSAASGLAVDSTGNAYVSGWTCSSTFPVTTGVYQTNFSGVCSPGQSGGNGFVAKINPAASGSASLVYSTLLGPVGTSLPGLAIDNSGNAYVVASAPASFPTTLGAFGDGTPAVGVYVTKLNPAATALVYSAWLGPGVPSGIAVDGSGAAYITGTPNAGFQVTAGAYQTTYPGGFVTKLSVDGSTELYSTFLAGPSSNGNNVTAQAITVSNGCSSSCNAYVSGYTTTTDFPLNAAIQTSPSTSGSSAFLVELAADGGSTMFSSYLSGLGSAAAASSVAVDNSGNISVVGSTSGDDFPITIMCAVSAPGVFLARIGSSSVPFVVGYPNGIFTLSQVTLPLRNVSSTTAMLQSIQSASSDCGGSIPAGGYCNLTITPDLNDGTETVTITSNASNSPAIIAVASMLTATDVQASLGMSFGNAVSFGNVDVGATSAPQTVTVSGDGFFEGPGAVFVVGNIGDFSVTGSTCGYSTICTVSLSFHPQAPGTRGVVLDLDVELAPPMFCFSGTGIGYPLFNCPTLFLTGTGVAPLANVSPLSLSFPGQILNTTSTVRTVGLRNPGNAPLTVSSIGITGANANEFAETDNCNGSVAVRVPCAISVTFTPSANGPATATLVITDNNNFEAGSVQQVPLTGTGLGMFQLTLGVSPSNGGGVTPKPKPTNGYYVSGTKVCLTATPSAGWIFNSWSGATLDSLNCLVINGSASVTANFTETFVLTLTASPSNGGVVAANPQPTNGYYVSGTIVCVTATPSAGWLFSSWSGASLNNSNCLTMNANASVTANFLQETFTLALVLSPSGSGSIVPNPPPTNGSYLSGTKVCLTETPDPGWQFVSWAGASLDASNCLTMNAGASVSANFLPLLYTSAIRFVPITPCRAVDTRNPTGPLGGPSITGNTSRSFAVAGNACGIPAIASAYSLNATVVPQGSLGYLTIWPTGQTRPPISTLNSLDGRIKANAAMVPAGTNGTMSVYVTDKTDAVLDINGYFVPASDASALAFYPLAPCRIADTRAAAGPTLNAGQSRTFAIAGSCSVPSTAQAYSLNFTVVPKTTLGYLTVWPNGQQRPLVSTLNALTGAITANAAIVPAGTSGDLNVYATDATDLIIDVNGYFAPPGTGGLSFFNLAPCRVLDTRNPPGSAPITGKLDIDLTTSACSAPSIAQAYAFNATVVPPAPLGYISLWPEGQSQPVVSTLNAIDGAITSNMAIVPTNNGSISAYFSGTTYLVLDIFGYFAP